MSRATCNSLLYLSAFKVGFLISSPYHSDSAVYGMIGDVIKFAQFITVRLNQAKYRACDLSA